MSHLTKIYFYFILISTINTARAAALALQKSLDEQVIESVINNDLASLTQAVREHKIDLDFRNADNLSALEQAVKLHHVKCIEILMKNFPGCQSRAFCKALLCAAHVGTAQEVQALLKCMIEKENEIYYPAAGCGDGKQHDAVEHVRNFLLTTDDDGNIPLHCAAHSGNGLSLKELINERLLAIFRGKVYVNVTNNAGMTPLHVAASKGSAHCVTLLCSLKQCDVTKRDNDGRTALACAFENGHVALGMNEKRLMSASDYKEAGKSVLHYLARNGFSNALCKALNRFTRPQIGNPPAGIHLRNSNGESLHEVACKHNHAACLSMILGRHVDSKKMDDNRAILENAFEVALNAEAQDCVELLISHESTLVPKDPSILSDRMLGFLKKKGVKCDLPGTRNALLEYAKTTETDDPGKVVVLLNDGAHIDAADDLEKTALHYFAQKGFVSSVQLLLDQKTTNVDRTDGQGWAPLHYAAGGGHFACVQLLVRRGAVCDVPTHLGEIPLELVPEYTAVSDELLDSTEEDATSINSQLSEGVRCIYLLYKELVGTRSKNSKVARGRVILHYAIELLNPEFVGILLHPDPPFSAAFSQDPKNREFIHRAAMFTSTKLHYFVKDADGMTPLHLLARKFPQEVAFAIKNVRKNVKNIDFPTRRAELVFKRFKIFYDKATVSKRELIEDLKAKVHFLSL